MNCYNPLLLIDFYKATHHEQYPIGLTKMVSYYTPRMSRLKDTDKVTLFGLQGFIKDYLIDSFNVFFFGVPEETVVEQYNRVLTATLGAGAYEDQKIRDLHQLGYLPLEIRAVPEGIRTKIGVPQIEIFNTHPNFVWLVNTIETMLSCSMWHTQVSAEVGYRYRQIVNYYKELTCEDDIEAARLLGDFSMRGQQSVESAIKSSAGWLLSFYNTATVPAILWLEKNYNCDCTKDKVGYGMISTEHSVMCSNYAIDGDEITHIKRLLTEIYPNHNFSMVSDSYDYNNLVTNILPQCKEEILNHNGLLGIRGDSGDPVEVIAGKPIIYLVDESYEILMKDANKWYKEYNGMFYPEKEETLYFAYNDKYFQITFKPCLHLEKEMSSNTTYYYTHHYENSGLKEIPASLELLGTVWSLWNTFGGTINSKGYKVLNPHVKAIYGDSITPQRCEEIYRRLTEQGFSISNVSLGVGSFSMMCLEEIDGEDNIHYSPYTRDTFGIAVKATYAEDENGNPINIFKNPKGASFKKSQKGCCFVNCDGTFYCDELTWDEANYLNHNLLTTVFKNGKMVKEYTLDEVRNNLYNKENCRCY